MTPDSQRHWTELLQNSLMSKYHFLHLKFVFFSILQQIKVYGIMRGRPNDFTTKISKLSLGRLVYSVVLIVVGIG